MANTTQFILQTAYGSGTSNAGFTLTGFNSLASGSCVVASTAITYSSGVDPYLDFSFKFVVGGTTVAGDFIALYILPLNQDGTTYGDGTASGSTPPASGYLAGSIGVAAGITSGNNIVGTIRGVIGVVENFKFAIVNKTSVAFNATASAATSYNTYRENLAA